MAKIPKLAKQLAQVGERYREGQARLHPLPDKALAAVRAAVQKQWKEEQAQKVQENVAGDCPPPETSSDDAAKPKRRGRRREHDSKSQDHGQSH